MVTTILHFFNILYYAWSNSYIYTHLLTPRRTLKKPFLSCFMLQFICVLPCVYLIESSPKCLGILFVLSLIVPLFLFKDSAGRRILCFILAYILQLLTESLSYLNMNLLLYLIEQKLPPILPLYNQQTKTTVAMIISIIMIGSVLIYFTTGLLKKWFQLLSPHTFILTGMPLLILVNSAIVWKVPFVKPGSLFFMSIMIFLNILCYPLLLVAMKELNKEIRRRYFLEKQHDLIKEQFLHSQQLEKEYRELRKWNHDIANHLISVSYLIEHEKYDKAVSYLDSVLESEE